VTGAALLAITGVVTLAEDDSFSDVPTFPAMLKPFPAGLLPTMPVDRLGEVAEGLKREADALAEADR
jgi:hypothetical protein